MAWLAWAKSHGMAQTDDEAKKLTADARFVNSGGALVEPAWRAFLEKDVLRALADLRVTHDAYHNKYVGVKCTKLDVEGGVLISTVGKQAEGYATEVYTQAKLDVPESIKNPPGVFAGPDVASTSRVDFETKRKILLERLERALATAPAPAPTTIPAPTKRTP